jgi:cysteine desulfurase
MTRGIYLDNSMITRPSETVIAKMLPYLTDMWGTPSAPHQKGQELFPSINESLRAIYALIGAKETDDLIFTSSGAEAINQVILSTYFDITRPTGKNQYITSHIDEAPAIMSIGRLEKIGCVGKMVNANKNGMVTAEAIAEAITPRTALVSLSWANGLTGVINPVSEIAALCHERGIRFHLDATHILGKLFFELEEIGAHLITFNGDQLHAPKGTGGLYIKEGINCSPFIVGGLEQAGHRAGSLNVPALVAMGQAAVEALDTRDLLCTEVARLRDKLEQGIVNEYPQAIAFFCNQERLPHCTTIAFPGIVNEALLYALNRKNVFASIGGGSFQQIGLILANNGIPLPLAHSALSFSLSRETTEDEIDRAIAIIGEAARKLKKVSAEQIYEDFRWD